MSSSSQQSYAAGPVRPRSALIVVALSFVTIAADGYDLIVYGAALPQLLYEPGWEMTPDAAGAIGSWTLVGMMVGFVLSGPLADRIGRRTIIMAGLVWFSIGSVACAFAQSPEFLGTVRFVTGIGLGGVVPTAVVLTVEFAPHNRRQLYSALMLTGYSVGGVLSTLVALAVVPDHSWRVLFALSGLFLLILPAMYVWLPESTHHLALRGRTEEAHAVARQHRLDLEHLKAEYAEHLSHARSVDQNVRHGYRLLLSRRFRLAAVIFAFVCFCSQLVVYGLNTWLPEFMQEAGYSVGPALEFFLVLQVSAVIGMLGGALVGDRFSPKPVMIAFFLIGAVSLIVLGWKLNTGPLMAAVAGAGLGTAGTTMLLYGYAAAHFPVSCRGSAVGASMGLARIGAILGPLLGGWIIESSLSQQWNFYTFAMPLGIAAVAIAFVTAAKAGTTLVKAPAPQPVH